MAPRHTGPSVRRLSWLDSGLSELQHGRRESSPKGRSPAPEVSTQWVRWRVCISEFSGDAGAPGPRQHLENRCSGPEHFRQVCYLAMSSVLAFTGRFRCRAATLRAAGGAATARCCTQRHGAHTTCSVPGPAPETRGLRSGVQNRVFGCGTYRSHRRGRKHGRPVGRTVIKQTPVCAPRRPLECTPSPSIKRQPPPSLFKNHGEVHKACHLDRF